MLDPYAQQDVNIKVPASYNEYGEPTYTTSTVKARFSEAEGRIKDVEGRDVLYQGALYTDSVLDAESQVTYGGEDYEVMRINTIRDISGAVDHYEILLGRAGGR